MWISEHGVSWCWVALSRPREPSCQAAACGSVLGPLSAGVVQKQRKQGETEADQSRLDTGRAQVLRAARKSQHLPGAAFSPSPKAPEPVATLWESKRRWVSQPERHGDTPFLCAPHTTSLCRPFPAHPQKQWLTSSLGLPVTQTFTFTGPCGHSGRLPQHRVSKNLSGKHHLSSKQQTWDPVLVNQANAPRAVLP